MMRRFNEEMDRWFGEHEEKREGYYRSERSYGTFSRIIPLPEGANVDQAKAEFNNGVVEVTVPIPKSARRRRETPIGATAALKTRASGGGTWRGAGFRLPVCHFLAVLVIVVIWPAELGAVAVPVIATADNPPCRRHRIHR